MSEVKVPEGYKQTEVGVIPNDWEVVSLNDIASFGGGTTPPRMLYERYYARGIYPWVKTLDLNNSFIWNTEEHLTELTYTEISLKRHPIGTVLVAMYGGFNQIGRTGLLKVEASMNQALVAVIPKKEKLVSEYLLYNLNFNVDYWKEVASSSRKDPNITSNDVKSYLLAIPLKQEQNAIATALSDVDNLIQSIEKLIAKKEAIKTGTMQQLLTGKIRLPEFSTHDDGSVKVFKQTELGRIPEDWEILEIGKDATLKARIGWQALTTNEYLENGDFYLVTGTDFNAGEVKWSTCWYVDEWRYKQDSNIQLRPNDVLVTKDGTIGKVGYIKNILKPTTLNSGVFVIRAKNRKFEQKFLFYILTSQIFKDFIRNITAGSTITHLYQKDFVNFKFQAPNIKEQTAIATTLSNMDTEIQALQHRLEKTKDIKQGMMQQLLTGKVRLVDSAELPHSETSTIGTPL